MMIPYKLYMPLFILVCGVSLLPNAYSTLTIQNTDIAMADSNINVTSSITMESLVIDGDGITTRFTGSDESREYQFDRTATSTTYNIRWDSISSDKIQFTVLDVVTDSRGNGTGTKFADVELDDVSVAWTYSAKNIVSIGASDKVEYFFSAVPMPNAIVLSLNSPALDRLGGVFAITCPANSTLTGLLTNGTFVCTDMADFFP